jgi:16S rRNA (cytosine967-C5)-methyltransferase
LLKKALELAIRTLSQVELKKTSEHLALTKTVEHLGSNDYNAVRLAQRVTYETIRRQNFIDSFINHALNPKTIQEFNHDVRAFLRLYVYRTRIATDWLETNITDAKKMASFARSILGWKSLNSIEHILGLLLTQNQASILSGLSDEQRIALQTFHPVWFLKYCFKLLGRKQTITMLESTNQTPPIYIRLNTLIAEEDKLLEYLAKNGIKTKQDKFLKHTYTIIHTDQPPTKTKAFEKGLFYIQDRASCFAIEATNPKPGMTVLDLCAAPGAKTTYIAQLMENKGHIISLDYNRRRLKVWSEGLSRMKVKVATPIIGDAYNKLPFNITADVVILDPPCTSTGAFRKLPSAKWRIKRSSINRMAKFQWRMINNCARHVKPGGILVYSTCTITVEENELIIDRFLKWHPEFSLLQIKPNIGLPGLRGMKECRRLYPHMHKCNGFFIAKLLKSAC